MLSPLHLLFPKKTKEPLITKQILPVTPRKAFKRDEWGLGRGKPTRIFSAPCLAVSHPPLFLVHFILHLFMKRVSFYKTCFVSQKVHIITLLPMILAKEVSYTSPLWALYL